MSDRENLVEEHGEEAVVDLEEPFISGVESHIHKRQYETEPELDFENACTECGEAAHNFRCPSCGRPLCSRHTEVLGGYCSDYAGDEEGCQTGDDEDGLVTDGGQHVTVVCRNDGRQMGERPDGGYRCPECGHIAGVVVEVGR